LLVRYKRQDGGKLEKTAVVYVKKEHEIDRNLIDPDALKIITRLQKHNHSAYVVGGAVRDLLIGKRPKDFDVVTDAEPNQIKKLFRNSRIIGKRFRLVHIFFGHDKIIEVATFRSLEAGTFNNIFGSIEEDALRRDFSVNGLYYDPHAEQVLDFVHGVKDLRARKLKPIIPMERIFTEDPVRMIRAVKYSCTTGCRIGFFLRRQIKKSRLLMADISPSRISEEVFKILAGGYALPIVSALRDYGLFEFLMPRLESLLREGVTNGYTERFYRSLATLDTAVKTHHESRRSIQLSYVVGDFLFANSKWQDVKRLPFPEVYADIKELLKPVTPPNVEVERALVYLIRKRPLYQKHGALPLSEPEPSRPDIVPGMPGPDFGDPMVAMEGALDADMGDFYEQKRNRRRRRPGTPHVPHNANPEKVPASVDGHSPDGAPKKRRRPRKKKKPADAGAPQQATE
jgi:poly(A) polymerase